MSGPTTVIFTADPATALLSAAAIRAARAIAAAHAEADVQAAENEAARDANRAGQHEAARLGSEALAAAMREAESRIERLGAAAAGIGLAAHLAARPQPPENADPAAQAAHVRGLEVLADEMESALLTEAARRQADLGLAPEGIAVPDSTGRSQRLMERIAHLGPPPADLDGLARELDAAPPGERAELLERELRLRIQQHLETVQQRQVREASALIVEQSLQDLGYQVEEVSETLFVEGGVVHFRRAGWGDYMVRMRVDPKAGTANFNVVRAVDAGNNERSVLDHLAEDRWCAEFPALLKALEARGLRLDVTRRLQAGELPVQLVARERLPKFTDEESGRPAAAPLAREIK